MKTVALEMDLDESLLNSAAFKYSTCKYGHTAREGESRNGIDVSHRTIHIVKAIYTRSFSIAFLTVWIWLDSSFDSPVVTLAEMTGLETSQARPRAALEGTKT